MLKKNVVSLKIISNDVNFLKKKLDFLHKSTRLTKWNISYMKHEEFYDTNSFYMYPMKSFFID